MALRYEYSNYGLTIQHLSPLFINTKMNSFSDRLQETGTFVPDASTYAKYAINTLGKMDQTTGYWAHGIQVCVNFLRSHKFLSIFFQYFLMCIPPPWISMHIGGYLNKIFRQDYFAAKERNSIAASSKVE